LLVKVELRGLTAVWNTIGGPHKSPNILDSGARASVQRRLFLFTHLACPPHPHPRPLAPPSEVGLKSLF